MTIQDHRKRRHGRLTFKEAVNEQITALHDVDILDLSMSGARIEHTTLLRPGATCRLRVPLQNRSVTVLCHVVWSRAVGRPEGTRRDSGLLYHSGLEFGTMAPDVKAFLTAFLHEQGTPANDGSLTD